MKTPVSFEKIQHLGNHVLGKVMLLHLQILGKMDDPTVKGQGSRDGETIHCCSHLAPLNTPEKDHGTGEGKKPQ